MFSRLDGSVYQKQAHAFGLKILIIYIMLISNIEN